MTQLLQDAKDCVQALTTALDQAACSDIADVLSQHVSATYHWRGMYPIYEQASAQAAADAFYIPLRRAFSTLQRRPDIRLAGINQVKDHEKGTPGTVWVCEMGQLLGLFDAAFLDIPPTRKPVELRYTEFHRVENGKVAETAVFFDLLGLMRQAGQYPLPPQTGASLVYSGPRSHDGILSKPQDPQAGIKTMDLVHEMVADLSQANEIANKTGENHVPREVLAKCWHEDMIWTGPEGIGTCFTIDRYQQQHQYPFRFGLEGKTFNGHVARFAEGNYACFFGWPNLTNTASGGFLGLPASGIPADMRVVDVYRRDGDKLAENWVLIDLPHWLKQQGLDVLARMRQQLGIEQF